MEPNKQPMNIAFFVRHFTERGTEVATYDYADFNETVLGNKSIIFCFSEAAKRRLFFPQNMESHAKFAARFPIVQIDHISEMRQHIVQYNLHGFYSLTHGKSGDVYDFGNRALWQGCRTIMHCVFDTRAPESDRYCAIAPTLNEKFGTSVPVVPHIVWLPETDDHLRAELNIPPTAVVYGRHGGKDMFNISFVHEAICQHLARDPNCYFLFLNTKSFCSHPRILYLEGNTDLLYKTKFINTCDAMIHARGDGETFGLSVAEFSLRNKPVITSHMGDKEHLRILGDKALVYHSAEELLRIFATFPTLRASRADWNAYRDYSPEKVMAIFQREMLA